MQVVQRKFLKVMVVEDDLDLCEGWREVFELLGHTVHCFTTATEALAADAVINSCELIITDYYLPDMNGAEFVTKARHLQPKLPVVFLTGSREQSITENLQTFDCALIVHKPVSIDELEQHIYKMVPNS